MKIRTGARIAGSNQTIDVELDDTDMEHDHNWGTKNITEKFQSMTKAADSLVVEYMYRNGHISKEYASQRLSEIASGLTS